MPRVWWTCLIPRGGASLIRYCVENATVPVIETGTGNCHIYLHRDANVEKTVNIVVNAKCSKAGRLQRRGVAPR